MEGYNHLDKWLPPKIVASGLSVEMFARKVGLSRAQLYRYFTDVSRPRTETMAKICKLLGLSLEEGLKQYSDKPNGRPREKSGRTRSVIVRQR